MINSLLPPAATISSEPFGYRKLTSSLDETLLISVELPESQGLFAAFNSNDQKLFLTASGGNPGWLIDVNSHQSQTLTFDHDLTIMNAFRENGVIFYDTDSKDIAQATAGTISCKNARAAAFNESGHVMVYRQGGSDRVFVIFQF